MDGILKSLESSPKVKAIIDLYDAGTSMNAIARKMGINYQTVRKVLITFCKYTSPIIRNITELYSQGKSINEICGIIKISRSAVSQYLPYKKPTKKIVNPSKNAMAIQNCRNRQLKNY